MIGLTFLIIQMIGSFFVYKTHSLKRRKKSLSKHPANEKKLANFKKTISILKSIYDSNFTRLFFCFFCCFVIIIVTS